MNLPGIKTGFEKLNYTWKRYFKFLGLDFNNERQTREMRLLNITTFTLTIFLVYQSVSSVIYTDDVPKKSIYISSSAFAFQSLCKLVIFAKGKNEIIECIERFHAIYPNEYYVQRYNLHHLLLQYRKVEYFLFAYLHSILLFYWLTPILVALARFLFTTESFTFPLMYDGPFPFSVYGSWLGYLAAYILEILVAYTIDFIILCSDLCLFSLMTQLCLHFELIGKRISEIDAAEENAEQILKNVISYHQGVLDLCDDVNRIFALPLTLSMLTSCFILCFNGLQLLDKISIEIFIKVVSTFFFEFKQVIITCYYGELLMEKSERLCFELYNHNWYDGSNRYKKLVLITMCRTGSPSALNVARIADLNLLTLKFVMNNSYQAFTVLKATK